MVALGEATRRAAPPRLRPRQFPISERQPELARRRLPDWSSASAAPAPCHPTAATANRAPRRRPLRWPRQLPPAPTLLVALFVGGREQAERALLRPKRLLIVGWHESFSKPLRSQLHLPSSVYSQSTQQTGPLWFETAAPSAALPQWRDRGDRRFGGLIAIGYIPRTRTYAYLPGGFQ